MSLRRSRTATDTASLTSPSSIGCECLILSGTQFWSRGYIPHLRNPLCKLTSMVGFRRFRSCFSSLGQWSPTFLLPRTGKQFIIIIYYNNIIDTNWSTDRHRSAAHRLGTTALGNHSFGRVAFNLPSVFFQLVSTSRQYFFNGAKTDTSKG